MKNKKRLIILVVLLIILIGLFLIGKNKNKSNNINSPSQNTSNTQVDNFDKELVTGMGNEPGWLIKINGHIPYQEEVISNMTLDYGDSLWSGALSLVKQDSYKSGFQYKGSVHEIVESKVSSTTKNIIVSLKKETCHDDADKVHNYKIELNFNGVKTYKGCADVLE